MSDDNQSVTLQELVELIAKAFNISHKELAAGIQSGHFYVPQGIDIARGLSIAMHNILDTVQNKFSEKIDKDTFVSLMTEGAITKWPTEGGTHEYKPKEKPEYKKEGDVVYPKFGNKDKLH